VTAMRIIGILIVSATILIVGYLALDIRKSKTKEQERDDKK